MAHKHLSRNISRRKFVNLSLGTASTVIFRGRAFASDKTITLRLADSFPPNHIIAQHGTQWWMKRVEELTDGEVMFEYFGSEQMGKVKDYLALTQGGAIDIAYIPPSYYDDRMPLSTVHNLPNLFSKSEVGSQAFYKTVLDTPLHETDFLKNGIRFLWGAMVGSYNIFTTNKPVQTVGDLQGLQLKAGGASLNEAVRLLGAVPINIPTPELYQALHLGTVDGASFPPVFAASYKLNEVVKYYTSGFNLGNYCAPYSIRTQVWDKFSPEVQKAFETASQEVVIRVSRKIDEAEQNSVKAFREAGIEIAELTSAERAKVDQKLEPAYGNWLASMKQKELPGEEVLAYFRKAVAQFQN